ncbi:MAG: hypothetical protein JXA14_24570 [Anaerolineae bacterium]|nr:hypothetical protein [Anaerolineae bacterium]
MNKEKNEMKCPVCGSKEIRLRIVGATLRTFTINENNARVELGKSVQWCPDETDYACAKCWADCTDEVEDYINHLKEDIAVQKKKERREKMRKQLGRKRQGRDIFEESNSVVKPVSMPAKTPVMQ